jgi:hypothetical protein
MGEADAAVPAPSERLDAHRSQRSNDSDFGALDEAPTITPWRVRSRALDFTIRVVTTDAELQAVQALRAAAYGHHLPHLAESFGRPDPMDRQDDTIVFFAQDKRTGTVVGTCRVQVNLLRPLQIEESVPLPAAWRGRPLSEITRLSVLPGYNHQPVRLGLVKACHLFCVARQIGGVLAGSRRSLLRQYRSLGFVDVFEDERVYPLRHAGNLDHRILFRDSVTAEADARAVQHPDYDFVFRDHHPDIHIFDAIDHQVDVSLRRGHGTQAHPRAA